MSFDVAINDREFRRNLRKFATLSGKGMGEVIETQARGYLRRVIAMTPPQGGGSKGIAAKKGLEGRILSDLHGIFAPKKLSGKRPEEHPDLAQLFHAQRMRRKKSGFRRMPGHPKVYVDARKFNRLYRDVKRKVGRLGGGWNAAADSLNVKRPAWMRRHGISEGRSRVRLSGPRPVIVIENTVPYQNGAHLGRISAAALSYQERALARQLPFLMRRYLRGSRLSG